MALILSETPCYGSLAWQGFVLWCPLFRFNCSKTSRYHCIDMYYLDYVRLWDYVCLCTLHIIIHHYTILECNQDHPHWKCVTEDSWVKQCQSHPGVCEEQCTPNQTKSTKLVPHFVEWLSRYFFVCSVSKTTACFMRVSVFQSQVRMAKGIREASHAEVVFNVVLSTLILITGIERLRT